MGSMAFHEQSLLLTKAWQQHVNRPHISQVLKYVFK